LTRPRDVRLALALLLLASGACASAAPAGTVAPVAAAARPMPGATSGEITAEDVRLRVGLLAHDSMRGREAGSTEKRKAADYIASELARLGLRPGGQGGSYFQPVPLRRTTTRVQATVSTPGGDMALGPEQALLASGLGGLTPTSRSGGEGPIVFGGYMLDPAVGQELSFEQVNGAVVLVRLGAPPGVDENTAEPRMSVASLFSPQSVAAGVLLVAEGDLTEFWEYAEESAEKGAIELRQPGTAPAGPGIFLITPETAERLLGGSLDDARQPRSDLGRLRYTLNVTVENFEDVNVIGVLPGSDPARSQEFMTMGAHYDHVGVGAPVDGDSIYNGADDNASGTAAILEVAEYLATRPDDQRLARSVLFIWHAAEESGLLGSEHFTDNPTVVRNNMVAHINMDMVGRNHPDSMTTVGSRRLSTELGDWFEEVNRGLSRPFVLDYTFDAPGHPEMIYCRSDHWNFARYGIPSIMISSGLHDDYHKPSDHVDLIDNDKVARVAQLATALATRVANNPARPRVDQPVPPLGTPCS